MEIVPLVFAMLVTGAATSAAADKDAMACKKVTGTGSLERSHSAEDHHLSRQALRQRTFVVVIVLVLPAARTGD